jgi:hypothetical protein
MSRFSSLTMGLPTTSADVTVRGMPRRMDQYDDVYMVAHVE